MDVLLRQALAAGEPPSEKRVRIENDPVTGLWFRYEKRNGEWTHVYTYRSMANLTVVK